MTSSQCLLKGFLWASLATGPMFLIVTAASDVYLRLPAPISVSVNEVVGLLLLLPFASIIGALIAFVPSIICTTIMMWAGARLPWTRAPAIWVLVGATIGVLLGLTQDLPAVGVVAGLAAASATAALICRLHVGWDDPPLSSEW